jgi:hypothetical protein
MTKRTEEQLLMRKWWVLGVLALIFLGLSYGFISLALDSGSLWQYTVGIAFFVWAVKYVIYGGQKVLHR